MTLQDWLLNRKAMKLARQCMRCADFLQTLEEMKRTTQAKLKRYDEELSKVLQEIESRREDPVAELLNKE